MHSTRGTVSDEKSTVISFTFDQAPSMCVGLNSPGLVGTSASCLNLMRDGEILKSYWIALGSSPVGHKNERGDGRTPEGVYLIEGRTTDSLYYRAMKISYMRCPRALSQPRPAPG